MFENPRRGRQARNFTTNAPKILDLKSSSEQIFSRKLPLGAPGATPLSPQIWAREWSRKGWFTIYKKFTENPVGEQMEHEFFG